MGMSLTGGGEAGGAEASTTIGCVGDPVSVLGAVVSLEGVVLCASGNRVLLLTFKKV